MITIQSINGKNCFSQVINEMHILTILLSGQNRFLQQNRGEK